VAKKKYKSCGSILNHPAATVASYFVFQGMRYMTIGERSFKLALTLVFSLPFIAFGCDLLVSMLIAHGLNFLINGQIPVLMRYVVSDVGLTRRKVESALQKISSTARYWGVKDVLVFGSFSRFQMKSSSDLDLRMYHRPDPLSSVLAYCYAVYLRIWANWNFVPIDLYCFTDPVFLDRMRKDEAPALLLDSEEMQQKYPSTLSPEEMLKRNSNLK